MRIILRHISGRELGKRETFPVERILIGRDSDCHVRFDLTRDLEVSGRHAEIVPSQKQKPGGGRRGYQFEICDLGSTNGTLVNGEAIANNHPLNHGDEIELGEGGPRLRFGVSRGLFQRFFALFGLGGD